MGVKTGLEERGNAGDNFGEGNETGEAANGRIFPSAGELFRNFCSGGARGNTNRCGKGGDAPGLFRVLFLDHPLQPFDGFGVDLGNAGFGDAENFPDFFESKVLVIIQRDRQTGFFRELLDHFH